MAFVPYPKGTTGSEMSGHAATGPFHLKDVYVQAPHKVFDECELK